MKKRKLWNAGLMLALLLGWSVSAWCATTWTVKNRQDSGVDSLRQDINSAVAGDTINFNAALMGGTSITAFSQLLIGKQLTIDGGGVVTVGANGSFAVFMVNSTGNNAVIQNLAIERGNQAINLSSCNNVQIINCRLGTNWGNVGGHGPANQDILVSSCSGTIIRSCQIACAVNNPGIQLQGSTTGSVIQGNNIGTDSTGMSMLANNQGIRLNSVYGNLIGGDRSLSQGNIISGNAFEGIYISGGAGNTVAGNIVGLKADQSATLANSTGITVIGSNNNVVGLNQANQGNIVAGNTTYNINLDTSLGNVVQNNLVGLNSSSVSFGSGADGIHLINSNSNLIGGNRSGIVYERNVISGHSTNSHAGIRMTNGYGNTICGNYIGTDVTGLTAVPNYYGIYMDGTTNLRCDYNLIGGANTNSSSLYGNVVAGNSNYGIYLYAGINNVFLGNWVGLDSTGTAALHNQNGINVDATASVTYITQFNQLGSATLAERNVIAGNTAAGIIVGMYAPNNQIQGNYLSTSADGLTQIINGGYDISASSQNNLIGGNTMAEGNLSDKGIAVTGSGNTITSNRIGVLADLSAVSSRPLAGLNINGPNNWVGLPSGGQGNLIMNCNAGVWFSTFASSGDALFANTICANTTNLDVSSGVNKPAPVITTRFTTLIGGTAAANDYVEIFVAEQKPGNGGSLRLLGYTTADGSGNWSYVPTGVTVGTYVTAMATNATRDTSNFATNVILTVPTPTSTSTPTLTSSPTATPSATVTPTMSATFTVTPSGTPSSTFTASPTQTASPTFTSSSTATPSMTATSTSTSSATATPSATVTPTLTVTPTATISPTPSVSPTQTPTTTITVTATISPTNTVSATLTPTVTSTPNSLGWDREIRAFPNPGRERMVFRLVLDEAAEVKVLVYNFRGERIAMIEASLLAGQGSVTWNCSSVAPGVYLARLQVNGQERKKIKVAVIR